MKHIFNRQSCKNNLSYKIQIITEIHLYKLFITVFHKEKKLYNRQITTIWKKQTTEQYILNEEFQSMKEKECEPQDMSNPSKNLRNKISMSKLYQRNEEQTTIED